MAKAGPRSLVSRRRSHAAELAGRSASGGIGDDHVDALQGGNIRGGMQLRPVPAHFGPMPSGLRIVLAEMRILGDLNGSMSRL